jgi:hypothetical protein
MVTDIQSRPSAKYSYAYQFTKRLSRFLNKLTVCLRLFAFYIKKNPTCLGYPSFLITSPDIIISNDFFECFIVHWMKDFIYI